MVSCTITASKPIPKENATSYLENLGYGTNIHDQGCYAVTIDEVSERGLFYTDCKILGLDHTDEKNKTFNNIVFVDDYGHVRPAYKLRI